MGILIIISIVLLTFILAYYELKNYPENSTNIHNNQNKLSTNQQKIKNQQQKLPSQSQNNIFYENQNKQLLKKHEIKPEAKSKYNKTQIKNSFSRDTCNRCGVNIISSTYYLFDFDISNDPEYVCENCYKSHKKHNLITQTKTQCEKETKKNNYNTDNTCNRCNKKLPLSEYCYFNKNNNMITEYLCVDCETNQILEDYMQNIEENSSPQKTQTQNLSNEELGEMYERHVGYTYEQKGFDVIYSGIIYGHKDQGRDLICTKDDITIIVQCKY